MKRIILLFVILFALVTAVHADFDVIYTISEDTIYPDELAVFNFSILNEEAFTDRYTVYSIDPAWIIKTTPVGIEIPSGGTATVSISIQPKTTVISGPYLIPLTVRSSTTSKTVDKNVFVYLKSYTQEPKQYEPSIALSADLPESVDPRKKISIELFIRNRNALTTDALNVSIESALFTKQYLVTLDALEEKSQELLFDIDPLTKPGEYPLVVKLSINNKTASQVEKTLVVIDYSALQEESYTVKELFKQTDYITVQNVGNNIKTSSITREKGFFARIFTSTEPDAAVQSENGRKLLAWELTLQPNEKVNLVVVENYRGFVSAVVILILIILGYYLFRSPIIVLKKAKFFGTKEEGSSMVKVKIFMKNRTKRPVYNVKVIDKIPALAKVIEDEFVLGTLKPTKIIRNEKAMTVVRWDLEKLDAYEERIITYKIQTHFKLFGSMKLQPTKVKFDTGLGKERSTFSKVVLIAPQFDEEEPVSELKVNKLKKK
ncbi:hypothetical protein C4573_03235 [Candidatus Woesearchaeota archaeon]|nr:MAG: hypothetical protein C4573_03235 [Candidatus Woesearchaeota archaeon]